jgi:thiol-disulfide isomerase/thioredoxin
MPKFCLVLIISFFIYPAMGQVVYQLGDEVKNFPVNKIVNENNNPKNFNGLKGQITILDFFGTWCVPCIKALPELTSLQQKFASKVKVLLISTEEELRLTKFVNGRKGFPFPVIIDENGSISNLFQPPSFPYTVIINEANKIIAITDAGSIKETMVNNWLAGKSDNTAGQQTIFIEKTPPLTTTMNSTKRSSNNLVSLSQDFMYAAKTGGETNVHLKKLKEISFEELKQELKNDDEKKAFWINAYNGYTQALLRKNPGAYKKRGRFFKCRQIEIAGKKFSLDDIEHGILRRSKIKWSLGYLNKLFPGKTEKILRVKKLDYRIHFALNCGAKSCPPVAFYDPSNINAQLDIASTAYLTGEAVYDKEKNTLGLPAIMSWFRRDFGGKKKMLELVKQKGIIPEAASPKITFNKYDWALHLNNFQ